jgi:hypothetical protein
METAHSSNSDVVTFIMVLLLLFRFDVNAILVCGGVVVLVVATKWFCSS